MHGVYTVKWKTTHEGSTGAQLTDVELVALFDPIPLPETVTVNRAILRNVLLHFEELTNRACPVSFAYLKRSTEEV
jgi:hypothetical protein